LKECGVFGVSSAEYLQYAMKNRNEWESRGREVVSELVEAAQRNHEEMQTETGCGFGLDIVSSHSRQGQAPQQQQQQRLGEGRKMGGGEDNRRGRAAPAPYH
jgi:hypothetical protein